MVPRPTQTTQGRRRTREDDADWVPEQSMPKRTRLVREQETSAAAGMPDSVPRIVVSETTQPQLQTSEETNLRDLQRQMNEMRSLVTRLTAELKVVSDKNTSLEDKLGKAEVVVSKMYNKYVALEDKVIRMEDAMKKGVKIAEEKLHDHIDNYLKVRAERDSLGCKGDELAKARHDDDHNEDPDAARATQELGEGSSLRTETQGESSQAGVAGKAVSEAPQTQELIVTELKMVVESDAPQTKPLTEDVDIDRLNKGKDLVGQSDAIAPHTDIASAQDSESTKTDSTNNTSTESDLHPIIVHRLEKRLEYDPQAHMRVRAEMADYYYDPGSLRDQEKERLGLTHTPSESESDSDFEIETEKEQSRSKKKQRK
jgi:hypothetical protein